MKLRQLHLDLRPGQVTRPGQRGQLASGAQWPLLDGSPYLWAGRVHPGWNLESATCQGAQIIIHKQEGK